MVVLESEDNTIMVGEINWRPREYMHIEGVGTENATDVSSILGMIYKTHEERWSEKGREHLGGLAEELAGCAPARGDGRGDEARLGVRARGENRLHVASEQRAEFRLRSHLGPRHKNDDAGAEHRPLVTYHTRHPRRGQDKQGRELDRVA